MMDMKCLIVLTLCGLFQSCMSQESGETETVRFFYESHTHMMVVTRQAICYIFVLTPDEKAVVHTDEGLRTIELRLMALINDPTTPLTSVPNFALHTNLNKQCGKSVAKHYIVQ